MSVPQVDPQQPWLNASPLRSRFWKQRQLWIRTPGLGGNISVGTPRLEITSSPQDVRKTTFSPHRGEIAGFCRALKKAAQPQKDQHNWNLAQSPMSPYP